MEHLKPQQFVTLAIPGVTSTQIISPHNSQSPRVTITRVIVAPGAIQPPHAHPSSEQIWYAQSGSGVLLLADGRTTPICAGEVVRFAESEIHGFENTGAAAFEYISVTSPPINFDYAYANKGD
jgi:mannose-6-phosphate isomerase-like protein (cupin superfamily)